VTSKCHIHVTDTDSYRYILFNIMVQCFFAKKFENDVLDGIELRGSY